MSNGTSVPSHSYAPWVEATQAIRRAYRGPERRSDVAPIGNWLAASLDEIDYGVLLLRDAITVAHANHAARAELAGDHPLQLEGNILRARHPRDAAALREAISAATGRGMRRMLTLGLAQRQLTVSVVPVTTPGPDEQRVALLVLEKRQVLRTVVGPGFCALPWIDIGRDGGAAGAVRRAGSDGHRPAERRGGVHGAQPDRQCARQDRCREHPGVAQSNRRATAAEGRAQRGYSEPRTFGQLAGLA